MANQNMNDPENPNKRLSQDDVEKRNAAFTSRTLAGIVIILVLIVIIGYIYFANNNVETVPAVTTEQQAPSTPRTMEQPPATMPVNATPTTPPVNETPTEPTTNSINNTNNQGSAVNGATAPASY